MQKFHVGQPNVEVYSETLKKWMPTEILAYDYYLGGAKICYKGGREVITKHVYTVDVSYLAPGRSTLVAPEDLRIRPNNDDTLSWDDMMNNIKTGVLA